MKQEIARLGILPYPEFFAKSTHRGTPGPALLLHFVFSTVFIVAAPLSNANGYLVISTLFNYARTLVAGESLRHPHVTYYSIFSRNIVSPILTVYSIPRSSSHVCPTTRGFQV